LKTKAKRSEDEKYMSDKKWSGYQRLNKCKKGRDERADTVDK
jgi:hypothetical protein